MHRNDKRCDRSPAKSSRTIVRDSTHTDENVPFLGEGAHRPLL